MYDRKKQLNELTLLPACIRHYYSNAISPIFNQLGPPPLPHHSPSYRRPTAALASSYSITHLFSIL